LEGKEGSGRLLGLFSLLLPLILLVSIQPEISQSTYRLEGVPILSPEKGLTDILLKSILLSLMPPFNHLIHPTSSQQLSPTFKVCKYLSYFNHGIYDSKPALKK
jgi:hypothetical protein